MEHNDSKEKEVIVDIEIGDGDEASHDEANAKCDPVSGNKWGTKSLNKLVSGVLGFNGSAEGGGPTTKSGGGISSASSSVEEYPNESTGLLVDKNHEQSRGLVPNVDEDKEKKSKAGKIKKATPKPPRPPRGPSLDASDLRLIKEISKIAMKKRERIERIKALKKMKAARLLPSTSLSSSGSTIAAMVVTVLFFLVLIFQGLGSSTSWSSSSSMTLRGAPEPAPETRSGLTPVQFYKTVLSDDGAARSFVPPKA